MMKSFILFRDKKYSYVPMSKSISFNTREDIELKNSNINFNRELKFIFKIIQFVMKQYILNNIAPNTPKGGLTQITSQTQSKFTFNKLSDLDSHTLTTISMHSIQEVFIIITNLAFYTQNHKFLFSTKLVETFFKLIKGETIMTLDSFNFAISGR